MKQRLFSLLLALAMVISLAACGTAPEPTSAPQEAPKPEATEVQTPETPPEDPPEELPGETPEEPESPEDILPEDGWYYSRDEVALYIHTYGHLPDNFITKKEAEALGWSGGSVEKYAPGMAIGGGRFGNYEGLLPEVEGRAYTECDIDTNGASSRGAKRIVFSNDGLIYYTEDHYESFELLYGEE